MNNLCNGYVVFVGCLCNVCEVFVSRVCVVFVWCLCGDFGVFCVVFVRRL